MSLSSYDRFFPAQDLLPRQSPGRLRLGNLIALPLQGTCRRRGTTVFVDPETWLPFDDQFAFLTTIEPVTLGRATSSPEALAPVRHGPIAPETTDWRHDEIASDGSRNRQICHDVARAHAAGRNCLVLSNRIDHVEGLVEHLGAAGVPALVLHGRLKPEDRRAVRGELARLDGTTPLTVVAIDRVAGEGLDLPRLDTLFLAVPISFRGRVVQNLGRITRTTRQTSTAAHAHDSRDVRVPLLERMFRRRHRVMLKQGFTVADDAATRASQPALELDAREVTDSWAMSPSDAGNGSASTSSRGSSWRTPEWAIIRP